MYNTHTTQHRKEAGLVETKHIQGIAELEHPVTRHYLGYLHELQRAPPSTIELCKVLRSPINKIVSTTNDWVQTIRNGLLTTSTFTN